MTERHQPQNAYWTAGEQLGEIRLWRDTVYSLRLKAHVAEERYRHSQKAEIIPLTAEQGVRTYVHAKPYILIPDIRIGVRLYPARAPTGAIGFVDSSDRPGIREEDLGQAQGWYYDADQTIILWEAYLLPRYRGPNLLKDANSRTFWEGFERFLTNRFPAARQIVTPHDDPEYDRQEYQEFLQNLGYRRTGPAVLRKALDHAQRRSL